MAYKGLIDNSGEQFAYLYGTTLYTLDDEVTGRIEGNYIVDMEGNRMWLVQGDGIYTLDGQEAVGYLGAPRPDDYDI